MASTREIETVDLTPELTLKQLDRCRMTVWYQGAAESASTFLASLIARYGIDAAKVSDLVPKLYCRRCKWRVPVRVEIERMTGIYQPAGGQPYYF